MIEPKLKLGCDESREILSDLTADIINLSFYAYLMGKQSDDTLGGN
ncbi:MAG: hypothetical protein ACXAB7_03835 [Candidatus Kariarchaeaceae archaeon]|jgi:hypothetical protein